MSLFIDRKYIGLLSPRLKLFKKKKDNVWNFRCPLCLDSKKNQNKARAYTYAKKNDLYFKCHNCGRCHTIGVFIKTLDPALYKQYALERFRNGETGHSNYEKPTDPFAFATTKPAFAPRNPLEKEAQQIAQLPPEHFARKYVEVVRKIPTKFLSEIYYCGNFKALVDKLLPDNKFDLPADQRLVIPFLNPQGELVCLQGRALLGSDLRYITIKLKKDYPKVYGLGRVDPEKKIYVLEGPLDAMFLDNAIAAAGSDLPTFIKPENCVFIYDNEPRSKEILKKMKRIIEDGHKIFIWPPEIRLPKDINEMIQMGGNPKVLPDIIDKNTFTGLKAKMRFSQWAKVGI
jgi:hypothetical protein